MPNRDGLPASYDAWRLSGPPDEDWEIDVCRDCGEETEVFHGLCNDCHESRRDAAADHAYQSWKDEKCIREWEAREG